MSKSQFPIKICKHPYYAEGSGWMLVQKNNWKPTLWAEAGRTEVSYLKGICRKLNLALLEVPTPELFKQKYIARIGG